MATMTLATGFDRFKEKYLFWCWLLSLLLAFVITPLFETTAGSLNAFIFVSIVLAICAIGDTRLQLSIAVVLSLPTLVSLWLFSSVVNASVLILLYSSTALFFAYVILVLLKYIFADSRVDTNRLLASICIYFCLAIVWCMLFGLVAVLVPNSFEIDPTASMQSNVNQLMYFSIVTLTTVGYGDMAPLSAPAKSIAAVEALVGQIYLTVLVARLVGLHAARH